MSRTSLLAALLMCVAGVAQGALPDLKNMHDASEVMQNACKPAEQRRLQREAAALAGSEAPTQAARLVQEMLCGTTPQSRAYVLAHTASKVASTDEATGDTEPARPRMLPARSVQPAQMRACSPWPTAAASGRLLPSARPAIELRLDADQTCRRLPGA
jgi:hypothetical protein